MRGRTGERLIDTNQRREYSERVKYLLIAFLGCCGWSQGLSVPPGTRVYIHEMDGFRDYLTLAFREKGVRLELVPFREDAEFELAGNEEVDPDLKKRVAILRLQKVETGEVAFRNTYVTEAAEGGRRGGANLCAEEIERQVREKWNVPPPASAVARPLSLRVTSLPEDAELEINGEYWGSTPTAELTRLRPGKHTLVLKKTGFAPWTMELELKSGDRRTVHADLQKTGGIAGLH